jgi:hypothetical protein
LGKFWRVLQWKMLLNFWPFGLFYSHLVYFVVICYISSRFGMLNKRKIWQPRCVNLHQCARTYFATQKTEAGYRLPPRTPKTEGHS